VAKKAKESKKVKEPSEDVLRSRGYMTSDEFVDTLVPGLKEYLHSNWSYAGKDELHHPEDLISNVYSYIEVAYKVIGDFGVAEKKKP
jgi:hypothetical protein